MPRQTERVLLSFTPAERERLEHEAGDRPLATFVRDRVLATLAHDAEVDAAIGHGLVAVLSQKDSA